MLIGTDIIEISRVKKAIARDSFLQKIYTKNEIELINQKGVATAAVNFAAKEAVAKALGVGFRFFKPIDIEVLRNKKGAPYVILHSGAKKIAQKKNIRQLNISLSHCKEYAVAFCVGTYKAC